MQRVLRTTKNFSFYRQSRFILHPLFRYYSSEQSSPVNKRRVLVYGATLEGLTTAITLRQNGVHADICEQKRERDIIEELNGSITILTPSASRVLEQLQLLKPVVENGHLSNIWSVNSFKGRRLMEQEWDTMTDAPFVAIKTQLLHQILLNKAKSLGNGRTMFRESLQEIQQTEEIISCKFRNFTKVNYDAFVIADGVHSKIRDEFFNLEKPSYGGVEMYSVILPYPPELDYEDRVFEWWAQRQRLVVIPISKYELGVQFYMQSNNESGFNQTGRALVTRMIPFLYNFKGLGAEIVTSHIILLSDLSGLKTGKMKKVQASQHVFYKYGGDQFVHSNIALVGSAAHGINPSFWHDATVAFEDGYVLGKHLSNKNLPIQQALLMYNEERLPRIKAIEKQTKRFASRNRNRLGTISQFIAHTRWGLLSSVYTHRMKKLVNFDPTK